MIVGLDFIQKTKKSLKTKWDRERVSLGTPNLLTRTPERGGCSAAFDVTNGAPLREGEQVTVEAEGAALVARRNRTIVARADAPPPDLLQAVQESYAAKGTVAHVHIPAQVAEITLC